uniref:Uncharacterized protein n=1 Tax=Cacopsylla melanoneura TaxID=428564 RepID=A0A8D9AMU3_9HEMI
MTTSNQKASLKDQSRKNPSMQKDQRLLNSGITSSLKETLKDVLRMTMGLKLVTALRSKSHRIICTPRENLKDLNIPNSKRVRDPKHSSRMTTSNPKEKKQCPKMHVFGDNFMHNFFLLKF